MLVSILLVLTQQQQVPVNSTPTHASSTVPSMTLLLLQISANVSTYQSIDSNDAICPCCYDEAMADCQPAAGDASLYLLLAEVRVGLLGLPDTNVATLITADKLTAHVISPDPSP
jgi:hypothetical protein